VIYEDMYIYVWICELIECRDGNGDGANLFQTVYVEMRARVYIDKNRFPSLE
jgi:hypothetical protein